MPASSADPLRIFTVGHSTRTLEAFLRLLEAHGIRQLADVRSVPKSRRMPHFSQGALTASLHSAGVEYRHFPSLGGLRRPRPDSVNTAWRNESFRGYADHMQTTEFAEAVSVLCDWAAQAPTAVMCAEAVWWHCHRSLLADALLVRAVAVLHIQSETGAEPHLLHEFARTHGESVTYPGTGLA
jgi:uncharacterized protein (DUF488 family)